MASRSSSIGLPGTSRVGVARLPDAKTPTGQNYRAGASGGCACVRQRSTEDPPRRPRPRRESLSALRATDIGGYRTRESARCPARWAGSQPQDGDDLALEEVVEAVGVEQDELEPAQ